MTAQEARSKLIASGTADGLVAFGDYLEEKGYASRAAVGPWKSAARQVFQTVEGDGWGSTDVQGLDLDEYIARFATMRRGDLKAESVDSYRSRVRRLLQAYLDYLEDGRPPQFRRGMNRRPKPEAKDPTPPRSDGSTSRRGQDIASTSGQEPLVDYPFPLRSGQMAYLRLPRRVEKGDAERIASFVRSLVFEPIAELVAGDLATEQRGDD